MSRPWLSVPRTPQPYPCLDGQGQEPRSHLRTQLLMQAAGHCACQDHSFGLLWDLGCSRDHLSLQGGPWSNHPLAFLGAEKVTTGEAREWASPVEP